MCVPSSQASITSTTASTVRKPIYNVALFIDSGHALDYNASMLTRVEQCAATVNQGTLDLPARVLTPSAVSLWIVRSGGTAGLAGCR